MIKGKKIGLRAVEKEDLKTLKEFRNINSFRKNFREKRELSLRDQEKWVEYLDNTKNINYMFSIVDLSNKEVVGACGLLYIDWVARFADFSFYIGKNKEYCEGIISIEAVKLLLEYGFNTLNLNKIWMELYEFDNKKIDFFVKEFNFHVDGKLRQNCFEDGRFYDSIIISLLEKDFKKRVI